VFAGSAVGGPYFAYTVADNHGWIRHSKITPVVLSADWMVGEYRECKTSAAYDGDIMELFCPVDVPITGAINEHALQVQYWGQIKRPDVGRRVEQWMKAVFADEPQWGWRCQRRTDDLVCWTEN
jgi:hypothetical protein